LVELVKAGEGWREEEDGGVKAAALWFGWRWSLSRLKEGVNVAWRKKMKKKKEIKSLRNGGQGSVHLK
jgi:hypothetical protein